MNTFQNKNKNKMGEAGPKRKDPLLYRKRPLSSDVKAKESKLAVYTCYLNEASSNQQNVG